MSGRLESGTIVDGRYTIKHRIGAGGMAEVYCAEDLQLGRKVALKLLYARFAEDEEFVERFRREASSAAGLQHQNVVSVYDRGEFDGTSYIAMEFVDGRTLKTIVQQEGPLDPARAIELTTQVLRAARFAHKRGIIHRDFKPHNVIVDATDAAKVTDFGIARAGASDMTQTGSIMGTAQYLSPEQAQGLPVSAQSDLYSIGITLFELLTGRVPFEGDSAVSIALKQVSEEPPSPRALNPAVPPQLEAVVLRALEKEPARRFADADEFVAALQAAARALPRSAVDLTGRTTVAPAVVAPPAAVALSPFPATQASGTVPPLGPAPEAYAYPERALVDEPVRESRSRWWIAVLVGLLVAGALVAGLLLLGGKQVAVPSVVNAPQAEAEIVLRRAGFETRTVPKAAPEAAGTVIGQDPAGGTQADEGATVTLTVSSGPGQATVPDVAGQGRRAARRALTEAGFKVREVEEANADVGRDRVIKSSPDGGQRVDRGETITLTVSSGPELVEVPNVLRQDGEEARETLEAAGFVVRRREQEREDVPVGSVVAQEPASGRVAEGSTVTITLATEPEASEVPDVTGRSAAAARSALQAAGFKVATREQESENPADDGRVLAQSPGAGEAERGSTVTITVGAFDDSQILPDPGPDTGATGTTGP